MKMGRSARGTPPHGRFDRPYPPRAVMLPRERLADAALDLREDQVDGVVLDALGTGDASGAPCGGEQLQASLGRRGIHARDCDLCALDRLGQPG